MTVRDRMRVSRSLLNFEGFVRIDLDIVGRDDLHDTALT